MTSNRIATRKGLLARLLGAAQRRFSRARPGSVLIMVVALLVLLALIGTAAMSTARIDRISSAQNVKNTQIEILAEGVKNMALAQIVADLFNTNTAGGGFGNYRDIVTPGTSYEHGDAPGSDPLSDSSDSNAPVGAPTNKSFDAWLGSRLPEVIGGKPAWRFLSYPPIHDTTTSDYVIDDPSQPNAGSGYIRIGFNAPKLSYVPTYVNYAGLDLPAFDAYDGTTGLKVKNPWKGTIPFLAGDADGDGIADSFLFKLPVGTIGGVTYYAAYRVIDNNSAVNPNTALTRDGDFAFNGGTLVRTDNDGFFPGNIGFAELLSDYNSAFKKIDEVSNGPSYEFRNTINRKLSAIPAGMLGDSATDPVDDNNNAVKTFKYGTLADAMHMGLGRRLDNPGHVVIGTTINAYYSNRTRPYALGDAFAFAYRFCLGNANASPSALELDLNQSSLPFQSVPYAPAKYNTPSEYQKAVDSWYRNFDFTAIKPPPVRALLVTHNPTANAAPSHAAPGTSLYPGVAATAAFPAKISLNTAPYEVLWRGFYEVMCTSAGTSGIGRDPTEAKKNDLDAIAQAQNDAFYGNHFKPTPALNPTKFTNVAELHPGRMYRSPLRGNDKTTYLSPVQVMALRSAIAASNAEAMRRGVGRAGSTAITPRPVKLGVDPSGGGKEFEAMVFHGAPQPFITEIYAQSDVNQVAGNADPKDPINNYKDKKNPRGFVAIEIYNPYDVAIDLKGWRLARINRSKFPTMTIDPLVAADGKASTVELVQEDPNNPGKMIPASIGANQRMIIHNYNPIATPTDPDWAQYPPPASGMTPPVTGKIPPNWILVKELPSALGSELALLRPVNPAAVTNPLVPPTDLFDMVPCDAYDFTGMNLPPPAAPGAGSAAEGWHYSRANDDATKRWTFVYPGRYDGSQPWGRLQGTEHETWSPVAGPTAPNPEPEPWSSAGALPNPAIHLGQADPASTRNLINGNKPLDPFDFPIQFFSTDNPGPYPLGSPNSRFPFGGFARVGDVMQVPFVGSYVVRETTGGTLKDTSGQTLVEVNPVTMDAAFAEDTDTDDDDQEDIGRFSPVVTLPNAAPNASRAVNDLDFTTTKAGYGSTDAPRYNYHWAVRLHDYFTTISNPHDDYLPNVDPVANPAAQPVANGSPVADPALANKGNEDTSPVEGLVNLNTASWRVLSAIPFLPPSANAPGAYDAVHNDWVAKSIVYYRDVLDEATGKPHGPFSTLFELDRIPIRDFSKPAIPILGYYRDLWNLGNPARDADDLDGDFTPVNTGGAPKLDGVIDFEERFLSINRISNLVTLRSDTFTVYVLVQAWRDVNGKNPILEGQRRLAFIVDRSRVTSSNRTPAVYNVPTAN